MKTLEKRLYFWITLFCFILLFVDVNAQTLAGAGTLADPYRIYTASDLQQMHLYSHTAYKHFALQNDIDLSSIPEWTPIRNDTPTYNSLNGNGYTIKHLNISNWTTYEDIGLFGYLGGTSSGIDYKPNVYNLKIDSSSITWDNSNYNAKCIGFVAGKSGNFVTVYGERVFPIENVYVTSACSINVRNSASSLKIGGVLGQGSVKQGWSEAWLYGNSQAATVDIFIGGVVGQASTGERIEESFGNATLSIDAISIGSGDKAVVGGITGYGGTGDTIKNCFAYGTFEYVEYYWGGISGWGYNGSPKMKYCYSDVTATNNLAFGGLLGLSEGGSPGWTFATSTFFDTHVESPVGSGTIINNTTYGAVRVPTVLPDTAGTWKDIAWISNQSNLEAAGWDFTTVWKIDPAIFDGRPYLQWMDQWIIPPYPDVTIDITAPLQDQYFVFGDSVTVTWTGTGVYDTVTVQGDTVLGDSTYKILPTLGYNNIRVMSTLNPGVGDSVEIYTLEDGLLNVLDLTATATDFTFALQATGIDSIKTYISNDNSSWIYLGKVIKTDVLIDTVITYNYPFGFRSSGTIYVRGVEDKDTSVTYTRSIRAFGVGSPAVTCYYGKSTGSPASIRGYTDYGCRWVNNMTWTLRNHEIEIHNNSPASQHQITSSWTPEDRANYYPVILYPYTAFYSLDTVTSELSTWTFANFPYYNSTTLTANGYSYYRNASKTILYANDLINGIDSIIVTDLTDQFSNLGISAASTPMTSNTSLWMFKYSTDILSDTLKTGGSKTLGDAMQPYLLDTPRLIFYESSNYQRLWEVYALPQAVSHSILSDVESYSIEVEALRNFFRGIHPKILKNGVL